MRRMHYFAWLSIILIAALPACVTLLGQSASSVTHARTFHVEGTIRGYGDVGLSGLNVTFVGLEIRKIVSSDSNGFYATDLPIGLYTMSVEPSEQYLDYRRPLFRVLTSTNLTFNITLDHAQQTCDLGSPVGGPPPSAVDSWNVCGGWDSHPVPSEDHIPFQLSIQFGRRQATDHIVTYDGAWKPGTERSYVYRSGWIPRSGNVFVAYNLFTLQASHVVYDVQARTLYAAGNVVVTNALGVSNHADSMTFKIENGEAIPLISR